MWNHLNSCESCIKDFLKKGHESLLIEKEQVLHPDPFVLCMIETHTLPKDMRESYKIRDINKL